MMAIEIVGIVVAVGVLILLIMLAPDIRRYLRIRSM
jgi:hypothetical protein